MYYENIFFTLCVCGAAWSQDSTTDSQTGNIVQARLEAFPTEDRQHFTIDIAVGTPPQQLRVIFDTASSGLSLFEEDYCSANLMRAGCYNISRSSTYTDTGIPSVGGDPPFSIDGEHISLEGALHVADEFSLNTSTRVPSAPRPLLNSTFARIWMVRNCTYGGLRNYPLRSWGGYQCFPYSDGVLGTSMIEFIPDLDTFGPEPVPVPVPGPELTPWIHILNLTDGQISKQYGGVFGINFNYNSPSWVDLGGVSPEFAPSLIIPPFLGTAPDLNSRLSGGGVYSFSVFQMSVCGVSIFGETSSRPATVDTGATCLALPLQSIEILLRWIPAHCVGTDAERRGGYLVCILPEQEDGSFNTSLPVMSFALENEGRQLYIPLSSLLLDEVLELPLSPTSNETVRGRRYCLSLSDAYRISFGSMVVERLYTYINLDNFRVGFANKQVEKFGSLNLNAQCTPRATCVGQSRFNISRNGCEPPPCADFAFFTLDVESQTCVLSTGFMQASAALAGFIFLVEFSVNYLRAILTRKVIKEVVPL